MKTSADTNQVILSVLQESLSVKRALVEDGELIETISDISRIITGALKAGAKLFIFGNGGSAADAQHLAAEFVGRFQGDRRPLAAIALTTDTSALTAIANDYSFEQIFVRQLQALSHPGDVAMGLSTSGQSSNVVSAIRTANNIGVITVGMTGIYGGELAETATVCVRVPSDRTARIQEAHILIGHILCELVESEFVNRD